MSKVYIVFEGSEYVGITDCYPGTDGCSVVAVLDSEEKAILYIQERLEQCVNACGVEEYLLIESIPTIEDVRRDCGNDFGITYMRETYLGPNELSIWYRPHNVM